MSAGHDPGSAESEPHPTSLDPGDADYRGLFGALLRHSYDGVVLNTVSTRRMLEVSDSFCELTGYERDELVGHTSLELGLVKPDSVRAAASAAADRGEEGLYETTLYRKDGATRLVEFSHQILEGDLVLSIVRDVTSRHLLEEDLREQTVAAEQARAEAETAREVAEQARAEADRANRTKSEFLSRMSHELRTPLNSVLGFAQLLQLSGLDDAQSESVRRIVSGGSHLLDLISELLDISRIETGELFLSVEPLSLGSLLDDVLDLVRPIADGRRVTLEVQGDLRRAPYVSGDQQRLKQVLLNLLSNAIKYNRPDGRVVVSWDAPKPDRVRVLVRDSGLGIRPELLERLFTPFDRLGAETGIEEGTGLGLPLSRRLAEAMGGSLAVQTTVGEGSTFSVELDRAEPAEAAPQEVPIESELPSDTKSGTRHLVLYIEDNPVNVKLIERVVGLRGDVELISAMRGSIGIELARAHRPEVILLDLHLADMHGDEVLLALQSDPATHEIPVILMSADATPARVDQAMATGATAYLTKPLDLKRFLDLLEGLLGASSDG